MGEKLGENGQEKKTKKEGLLPLLLPLERESGIKRETPPTTPPPPEREEKKRTFTRKYKRKKNFFLQSDVTSPAGLQGLHSFTLVSTPTAQCNLKFMF